MKEALLEGLLRRLRIGRVLHEIRQVPECDLLDIGCGYHHKFLDTIAPYVKSGTGIDGKVPDYRNGHIVAMQGRLDKELPFPSNGFDVVTMLAVLEHLSEPQAILAEIQRVLRPGGKLILTVPSHAAKPVLEFLAFKIGIVSREEILDHKRYYNRADLRDSINAVPGLTLATHHYFQLGMNNFCVAVKGAGL